MASEAEEIAVDEEDFDLEDLPVSADAKVVVRRAAREMHRLETLVTGGVSCDWPALIQEAAEHRLIKHGVNDIPGFAFTFEEDVQVVASIAAQAGRAPSPDCPLGAATVALWDAQPRVLRFTDRAVESFKFDVGKPQKMPYNNFAEFFTDGCIYIDLRNFGWASPFEAWKLEGACAHLYKEDKALQVLYAILASRGNDVRVEFVPCAIQDDFCKSTVEWRNRYLQLSKAQAAAIGVQSEVRCPEAWFGTAPRIDALLSELARDRFACSFDYLADEGAIYLEAMAYDEAQERLDEQEAAQKQEEEAAAQALREAEEAVRAAQAAEAAEDEATQAEPEAGEQLEPEPAPEPEPEELLAQAAERMAQLEGELAAEREQVRQLQHKASSLTHALTCAKTAAVDRARAVDAQASRGVLFDALEIPTTVEHSLELAARVWPDRLAVAPQAYSSAKAFSEGDAVEAWALLRDMACVLYELVFSDESVDVEAEFAARSRFEVAMGEGPQTVANAQLMKLRTIFVDGRKWDIQAHAKGKTRAGRALRVHFAIDRTNRQLIIGHCGNHLPTFADR